MKKSFFKVSGFAGLMLLGGLTMVSCYEGDDSKIDYVVPDKPTPTPAKYYLSGIVTDNNGNQIKATVKVNDETYTTSGSFSKEVTLTSDRKYTVEATCTGYVTVTREVFMTEVRDGEIGTKDVSITMTKLEDVIADNQTPTEIKTVTIDDAEADAISSNVYNTLSKLIGEDKDKIEHFDDDMIATTQNEDGTLDVTVTVKLATAVEAEAEDGYVFEFAYPVSSGFDVVSGPDKATKATALTAEEMWKKQVSNYLGGMSYPMTTRSVSGFATVAKGKLFKGYILNYTIIEKEFTFAAGEGLDPYTGVVRYVDGSATVTPILVDDAHDDSHDDSHSTDSGTSYAGGTSTGN